MSDVIKALQLGSTDWTKQYKIPDNLELQFAEEFLAAPKKPYDVVFLDRSIKKEEYQPLMEAVKAHTLFVTGRVAKKGITGKLMDNKLAKRLQDNEIQPFLLQETRNYFSYSYGEKFSLKEINIAQGFQGTVLWNGNYSVTLQGDYGTEYNQVAFWRNNIPIFHGQAIEFWLEYRKDPGVEISLQATQFVRGSLSDVQQSWTFSEEELEDIVTVDNQMGDGPVFVTLLAKGQGMIHILALHDRHSRRGHGTFLPGGERYVVSNREEVFAYFDPGDRKPPLNVYFSGYKARQGFEGYNMMRKMGCPFLLISDARLEGGAFYMGVEEYEQMIRDVIMKHMQELGFSGDDVILSGLSMGTYGALYYGCDIRPHALLLGKPLASIGDVATNERLNRPGGFPTSLDVVHYHCGDTSEVAAEWLNKRFWDKFDETDFGRTKFIVSYMMEDDYDGTAYEELINHLWSAGVKLYGKGIHGRHNDDTGAIVGWFSSQFKRVLREDFGRKMEE